MLTLSAIGLQVVGLPSATVGRLAESLWQVAERFQQVILALDSDEAGANALRELANSCPEALLPRTCVVQPPAEHKDWNSLWVALSGNAERFRETLEQLPKRPLSEFRAEPEEQPPIRVVKLGDALQAQGETREREWLPLLGLSGWLAKGSIVLFGSRPKGGKSTLLATCACEWAEHGERVLIWSEERLPQWLERVQRMPALSEVYYTPHTTPLPAVIAAVESLDITVLITDTWRACLGVADENDAGTVLATVAPLLDLAQRKPDLTQVWVHHLRKAAQNDAEVVDFAGSSAISAAVDALMVLLPLEREKSARLLKPLSARYWLNTPEAVVLEMSAEGVYRVVGEVSEVEPELAKCHLREAIVDALRLLGESTATEIHEHLEAQENPVSLRRVRQVLDELVFTGVVKSRGQGTRANPRTYFLPERIGEIGKSPVQQIYFTVSPNGEALESEPEGNGEIVKSPAHEISFTFSRTREEVENEPEAPIGETIGEISVKFHPNFTNPDGERVLANEGNSEGNRDSIGFPYFPISPSPPHAESGEPSQPQPPLEGEALVEAILQEFQGSRLLSEREALEARLRLFQQDPVAPLEPDEVAQVLELWTLAESKQFPRLVIPDYAVVERGASAWRLFLERAAGSGAIALALELLQQRPNGQPSLFSADLDANSGTVHAISETLHNPPAMPS